MRATPILCAIAAPFLLVASAPTAPPTSCSAPLPATQGAPVKPKPCVRDREVTEAETKKRAEAFAQAFIYKKDISEAFSFIAFDYINHNPAVQNGSDPAWNFLSPIWASQTITPLRTAFKSPQSWLNYNTASFGQIVDRFRWEGGCIVEHWDQGEKFPANVRT